MNTSLHNNPNEPMKIENMKLTSAAPSRLSVAIWHRFAIPICAAAALAAVDRVSGQDVVINGGFEDPGGNGGTPTGWTKDFNSFGTYSGAAHSGGWGLHAGSGANSGGEYQDMTTTAGASYNVSLYVENFGAANGTSHFDVLIGAPGDETYSYSLPDDVNASPTTTAYASGVADNSFVVGSDTNGGWQQVVFQFTATGPITRLGIYNSYKTNDTVHSINVDEVSLVPLALGLQRGADNIIFLYWPAGTSSYVLQSSTGLDGGWGDAGLAVTTQGDMKVVMDTIAAGAKFYRLHSP